MSKVGGNRNFGYVKTMAWAGKQALRDRYGEGHHGSVATHAERWVRFAKWAKETGGIRDARNVDGKAVRAFGANLAQQVHEGTVSVSYAHNLLSTVNVVLEALRGDRRVRVSPTSLVGERTHVRTTPPSGLSRIAVYECAEALRTRGHERAACVVELARDLGLRIREASMLDVRAATAQAFQQGKVNITQGTKGGRGQRVDRWVPASKQALATLLRAREAQGRDRNLIPSRLTWRQWNDHLHHVWAHARDALGLAKLPDLRAAYACERYQRLTGHAAPAVAGRRLADCEMDREPRDVIAQELGHGRGDVVAAYVGGHR